MPQPSTQLLDELIVRQQRGRKSLAVLLDPDDFTEAGCQHLLQLARRHPVDYFFVGGSLVLTTHQAALIAQLK